MLRPKRSLVRAVARSDVPLVRRDAPDRPLALLSPPVRARAVRVFLHPLLHDRFLGGWIRDGSPLHCI